MVRRWGQWAGGRQSRVRVPAPFAWCRERHFRGKCGVANGTLRSLNAAKVPFAARPLTRMFRSRRVIQNEGPESARSSL